ncbi:hypothetical protein PHMEG_00011131 [Phytophthora megakarya]|uniref:PiggyBac transposable element-derived protein domain-containing protein n=1 Tax=Phytophthora megakarya TaxID=4795 RepID=A0A225WC02_9STRA|nr:hypothetical protein PHMEG_00011131 [Phytophthora megakarya]
MALGTEHELYLWIATLTTLDRVDIPANRKDASALWVAMCGHLTRTFPDPSSRQLLVFDNFYTRHNLAQTL